MNGAAGRGLEVSGLGVALARREVLVDIALHAPAGAVTAVLGPNGAGKSTLLRALLGLLPYRGLATLDGEDLRACDPARRARRLAYVPQRSALRSAMPVAEVVAMGRYAHQGWLARPSMPDREAVRRALDEVDAAGLAGCGFDTLSCGEQQRVLLARALASGAGAILLDEPTAALDIGHALALLDLLRRLAGEGRCLLVVLHQLDQVARGADRALLLHRGAVLAAGSVAEVLAPEPLRLAYGVEAVPGGTTFRRCGNAP